MAGPFLARSRRRRDRPHTHWDRGGTRRSRRSGCGSCACSTSSCADARDRPVVRPLPARRPDRVVDDYLEVRPRRQDVERLAATGRLSRRAVDGPHGRVHGVGRDDRARPPARPGAQAGARRRRRRRATSPTCSATSRRCPRSSGSPASTTRSCGAACRRRSTHRRSGGRRPTARGARRVPLRLLLERSRPPRRRQRLVARARGTTSWSSVPPVSPARHAADERHRPPDAAALARSVVAEANAIQDDYRFVVTSLPEYVAEQPADGLPTVGGRAAIGRAPTCSWAWRRTASTCTRRAPPPSGRSNAGRSRCRRCSCHVRRVPARCSRSRGATSCSTARTTRRARAATTRSSTRCWCATARPARSATSSRAKRCGSSPPRSTPPPARPSS